MGRGHRRLWERNPRSLARPVLETTIPARPRRARHPHAATARRASHGLTPSHHQLHIAAPSQAPARRPPVLDLALTQLDQDLILGPEPENPNKHWHTNQFVAPRYSSGHRGFQTPTRATRACARTGRAAVGQTATALGYRARTRAR